MNYRIVLIGPQGSGKGTQAELLSIHLGIPTITMGEILREAAKGDTEQARVLDQSLRAGELVPHEITIGFLKERLKKEDTKSGFILDGFPRAAQQQLALDEFAPPTHVIRLEISDDLAVERLVGRLVCPKCNQIYHEKWNPPKQSGVCDKCGAPLVHRSDDTPEAIKERLYIYRHETEPMLDGYATKGVLYRIDASGAIPQVHARILEAIGQPLKA
ncbi:MAG: nucleoside monophosphate kinase [bacterium]|nr:nucleoside monophosphate kinase [bacterium]